MANALNRNIKKGEEVVVDAKWLKEEFRAPDKRVFVCHSGFGIDSFTVGAKIFGYYKWEGADHDDFIRGEWISVEETKLHQAGKFLTHPNAYDPKP
jgi:hypothetical protein